MVDNVYWGLFRSLQAYGYIGSFAIALIGSLIPFLPVPYLFPIVLMSRSLDPLLLGISAGIGGALGKLTSYALGRFGRRLLSEERRRKMSYLGNIIGRYGAVAVFFFALTPLPDDVIYIPLGLTGLNFAKFMIANMLGKIALSLIVAYLGRLYFRLAALFFGEAGGIEAIIVAVVAMSAITVMLLRVDWEEVLEEGRRNGPMGALKAALRSSLQMRKNKSRVL